MQPIVKQVTLDDADADSVCESQSAAGAGDLTLDGASVSGGVAYMDSGGHCRQLLLTCAGNEASNGTVFTIYCKLYDTGETVSFTMNGVDATTAVSTPFPYSISRISVNKATAGAVTFGTNGVGASQPLILDRLANPFQVAIGCTVSGTVNYTMQHTVDNFLFDPTVIPHWFNHATIAAQTGALDGNYAFPVFSRLKINSGATSGDYARVVLQQSTPGR